LDLGEDIHLHDVLYVPGLKKNLVSIYAAKDKGMKVVFIKGKVLTCPEKKKHEKYFYSWIEIQRETY